MSEEHLAFIEDEAGYEQVIFVADFMCDVISETAEDVVAFNSLRFDGRIMDEGINAKRLKKILKIFVDLGLLADKGRLRGLSATPYLERWPALDASAKEEVLRRAAKGEALDDVFSDVGGEAGTSSVMEDEVSATGDAEPAIDETPSDDLQADDAKDDGEVSGEDGEAETDLGTEPGDVIDDYDDVDFETDDNEAVTDEMPSDDWQADGGDLDGVDADGAEPEAVEGDGFGAGDEDVGAGDWSDEVDHGAGDEDVNVNAGETYEASFDDFTKDVDTDEAGDAGEVDEGRRWGFSASMGGAGESSSGSSDWSAATTDDPNEVENFMASLGEEGGDAADPTEPKRPDPVGWASRQEIDSSGFEETQGWDEKEDGGRSSGWQASSSSSGSGQSGRGWGSNEDADGAGDVDAGDGWGQQPPPPGGSSGWGSEQSSKRWDGSQPSASGKSSGWGGDSAKKGFDPSRASASGWSDKKNTSFNPGGARAGGGESEGGGWNYDESAEEDTTTEDDPMSDFLSGSVNNLPGTETDTGGLGDWLDDDYGDDVPDAWRDDLNEVADYMDEHQQGATLTIEELEQVVAFLQQRLADLRERGVSDEKGLSVKFEIQINEIIDEMRRRAQDD